MDRDQLFLLNPDFPSQGRACFCPGCAEILGLLEYYPSLKTLLDIRFADFERPRPELVALLGEENQSCPVLLLKTETMPPIPNINVRHAMGHAFVEGAREIALYLANVHGTGTPY